MKAFFSATWATWTGAMLGMFVVFVPVWQEPDFYRPPPNQPPQVFVMIQIDQPDGDQMRVVLRAYDKFEDCQAVADSMDEANPADHRAQWCEAVTVEKVK
jgi:hypothetical protein